MLRTDSPEALEHAAEVEHKKNDKYKHVILATSEEISLKEAYRLAQEQDDDILSVLTLNKSDNVTAEVLEIALINATAETVKERIKKAIEEKSHKEV